MLIVDVIFFFEPKEPVSNLTLDYRDSVNSIGLVS
jgi:hypothetical protein